MNNELLYEVRILGSKWEILAFRWEKLAFRWEILALIYMSIFTQFLLLYMYGDFDFKNGASIVDICKLIV